ncbi:selenium metabolism-associated LysR family transcriptional regulator [Ammoniphilus sp. 3BR4]|uniref:selenium metabolism-associated LysR family transcriptional regulator n=1 Tax=Ammoniphilus sp. 3BR4 TaxID=3158265 RepID=UPI003465497F
MNIDHLQVFYIAATRKNFSETAKILHLSQPSVSLQIQNLEESLNTKLFERTKRSVKLTYSGKILYHYAEQIIHMMNKARKDLSILSESIHGDLTIGASLTVGEYILPYILGKFKQDYPKINISMKSSNSSEIIKLLQDEQIELGFVENSNFHSDLKYHSFLEDELFAIVSAKHFHHLIENKKFISMNELYSLPIILREQGSGTREVFEEAIRTHGKDPEKLNIILELGNTESIKAAVESGLGISIISQSTIQKELQLGVIRKLKIEGIQIRRFFSVIHKKNHVLSVPSEAFLNFVLNNSDCPAISL